MKSRENGDIFTDSVPSTPKLLFEYTDPSLRGEEDLNMNLGVLELKLHKVHIVHCSQEPSL